MWGWALGLIPADAMIKGCGHSLGDWRLAYTGLFLPVARIAHLYGFEGPKLSGSQLLRAPGLAFSPQRGTPACRAGPRSDTPSLDLILAHKSAPDNRSVGRKSAAHSAIAGPRDALLMTDYRMRPVRETTGSSRQPRWTAGNSVADRARRRTAVSKSAECAYAFPPYAAALPRNAGWGWLSNAGLWVKICP